MNIEIFKGPLGSHHNYIVYIVLPNIKDYLELVKKHEEEKANKVSDQYKRLRLFLNAAESINNIPEYYFHEKQLDQQLSLTIYLNKIREKHILFRKIEEITNAYKHCKRNIKTKSHAKDLQYPRLKLRINLTTQITDLKYVFNSVEDKVLIEDIFKELIKYINDIKNNSFFEP